MSVEGRNPDPEFARALFAAISSVRDLREASERAEGQRIAFSGLVQAVTSPDEVVGGDLASLRRGEPSPLLVGIARRIAVAELPAAAAASTGELTIREGGGYRLRVEAAFGGEARAYLIVERLDGGTEVPGAAIAVSSDAVIGSVALAEQDRGLAQAILEPGDPFLAAFGDPRTEILLT